MTITRAEGLGAGCLGIIREFDLVRTVTQRYDLGPGDPYLGDVVDSMMSKGVDRRDDLVILVPRGNVENSCLTSLEGVRFVSGRYRWSRTGSVALILFGTYACTL